MKSTNSPNTSAIVLLLITALLNYAVNANTMDLARALRERSSWTPGRELRASSKVSSLTKRHSSFVMANELDIQYAEDETFEGEQTFVASLNLKSHVPVLLLEEFEHLTSLIECRLGHMILYIHPGADLASSRDALMQLAGGLIITSHYGCNAQWERTVFRVGAVDMAEDASSITIYTDRIPWKKAFHSIEITMDQSQDGHSLRPHGHLRRRQAVTMTAVNTLSGPSLTATLTASVPTTTSSSSTNTLDVKHALINKDFFPTNSSLQITCTNCSTYGTIDFSFANFQFHPDLNKTVHGEFILGDLFSGGEATIVANGLGATVSLYTNISRTDELSIPLFEVPLLSAIKVPNVQIKDTIPGIGAAGLLYAPLLHAGYNLNGSIGFAYGFELTVPDQSRISLDFTDPTNSSVTGFEDSKIDPLPFQAKVDVDDVALRVGLRHQIQIGFEFDGFDVGANLGIYLDLPALNASIAHVSNVDENCTSLATSNAKDKDLAAHVLNDTYAIDPSVFWEVGLDGEAYAGLLKKGHFDVPFANGTIADIAPACLNYDTKSGTYVPAAQVVAKAQKDGSSNGAAGQLQVPVSIYWLIILAGLLACGL